MFCSKCGAQVADGQTNCPNCGAPVGGFAQQVKQGAGNVFNKAEQEMGNAFQNAKQAFNNNGYQQDGYQQNAYQQNAYQQNAYQQNAYQQNAYQPNGYQSNYQTQGQGKALQTDRNLIMYILLSIVTCGIYSYYFVWKMAADVNVACKGDGKSTSGLVAYIILSYITCGFYSYYWEYSIANRLQANAPRYGLNFPENGTTVLLWQIVGICLCGLGPFIAMNILIKNTNSICMGYNQQNNL